MNGKIQVSLDIHHECYNWITWNFYFNLLRNFHIDLHNGYNNYAHTDSKQDLFFNPHPCQHLPFATRP